MTRRRRWIIMAGGLATVLVATALVLREVSYTGRLPREMAARMPAHWRTPWFVSADVSRAIEDLYSPEPAVRADAADTLASLGPRAEPAVPFLVAALADVGPDPQQRFPKPVPDSLWDRVLPYFGGQASAAPDLPRILRSWRYAIQALVEVGPPAVEPLIAALKDTSPEVRAGAATALGQIGDERAVDTLAAAPWKMARRKFRWDRWDSPCPEALALASIGGRGIDVLIERLKDPNAEMREAAAMALGYCRGECPRAVEALASALEDQEEKVAVTAARSLGPLSGDRARDVLIAAMDNRVEKVRWEAVQSLEARPDTRAVDALLAALARGREPEVGAAADALGCLGDPRATEPLIAWLGRSPPTGRWVTARALGEFRDRRAVPALLSVLEAADSDLNDRADAVIALGKIGDGRAVPALIRMVEAKDEHLADEAKQALGRIGDARAVPALIQAMEGEDNYAHRDAQYALAAIGSPAVEPLIAVLGEKKRGPLAAFVLGQIGDRRAVELLLGAMWGDDPALRAAAARAVGYLHDPRAYEPLVALLEEEEMSAAAAEGLGYLGDPRAIEVLLAYVERYDLAVKNGTAKAATLVKINPEVARTKDAPAFGDANLFAPAEALIRLGDARGLTIYCRGFPPAEWATADPAFRQIGPLGVKVFAGALADEREEVRQGAAAALLADGSPEAVAAVVAAYPRLSASARSRFVYDLAHCTTYPHVSEALAGILRTDTDRQVRTEAAERLRQRGDPMAAEALRRAAAEDPLRYVRLTAADALEDLLRENPPDVNPPRWQTRHDLMMP